MTKKEIDSRYYTSHKEEVAERVKNYYLAHKEQIAKRKAEWYRKRKRVDKIGIV